MFSPQRSLRTSAASGRVAGRCRAAGWALSSVLGTLAALAGIALIAALVMLAGPTALIVAACGLSAALGAGLVWMLSRRAKEAARPRATALETERLNLALNAANTALWDADVVTGRVIMDARWSVMLGGPATETLGQWRDLARMVHPEDRAHASAVQRAVIAGPTDEYRDDYRVRTLNGGWIWIHSHGRVIERTPKGMARRIIGTNTDISARKHAEAALQRQTRFLAALQQVTLELLEQTDRRALLDTMLQRALTLLGAERGRLALLDSDALNIAASTPASAESSANGSAAATHLARDTGRFAWQAQETARPVSVVDIHAEPQADAFFAAQDCGPVAEIPILLGQRSLGVLGLGRPRGAAPFTAAELDEGVRFAQMAALVVRNADLRAAALAEVEARNRAMHESELRFRAVFDQSPAAMCISALSNGHIVAVNAVCLETFGFAREEVLGNTTLNIQLWPNQADRTALVNRLREGPVHGHETVMRHKSGRLLNVLYHGSVLLIDGQPHALSCVLDISARQEMDRALRNSEEKFRAVFDKGPIAIVVSTLPEGAIADANAAAAELFGYELSEQRGRTTVDLNIWVDAAQRARYVELLQTQGSLSGYEALVRRNGGQILTVLFYSSVVRIGDRAYVLNSLFDITSRKQAEAERARAEARFRDLFEFAPDAVLIATRTGIITDANRRAVELFGYTREELVGRSSALLMDEEARPVMQQRLALYLQNPVPHPMGASAPGLKVRRSDGTVIPIDIGLSPLRSGNEELVVAAVRDITDQQRVAEQQRVLELQLRQNQKMEALGTLAGGIAHDFNNLLTGILGHAELALIELGAGHPSGTHLRSIRAAGARSSDLVKQILTFSRRTEATLAPMRLQSAIADSYRLLRSTIPAMVRIECDVARECPAIRGDATQINQVLMNLCTNAWHALPEQGGVIEIQLQPHCGIDLPASCRPPQVAETYARLTVRDNGHGMDAATLERIYDPFFTTKPVGKGTGLGLSTVHGIVESHYGVIDVQSIPGRGTTFDLYFPAFEATPPAAAPGLPSITPGNGERILYVDDDDMASTAIVFILRRTGYTVEHCALPSQALALARGAAVPHDLLITDLSMPEMSGTHFARAYREIHDKVPVLLITGNADTLRDDDLAASGILEILRKPVAWEELAAAVRRALDSRAGAS